MFGPDSITLFLDKTAAILGIGFIIAACAIVMLKSSIEAIINGGGAQDAYARFKGMILLCIASFFLASGLTIILESTAVTDLLTHHVKNHVKIPTPNNK